MDYNYISHSSKESHSLWVGFKFDLALRTRSGKNPLYLLPTRADWDNFAEYVGKTYLQSRTFLERQQAFIYFLEDLDNGKKLFPSYNIGNSDGHPLDMPQKRRELNPDYRRYKVR
jgi:hypothetical protein